MTAACLGWLQLLLGILHQAHVLDSLDALACLDTAKEPKGTQKAFVGDVLHRHGLHTVVQQHRHPGMHSRLVMDACFQCFQ